MIPMKMLHKMATQTDGVYDVLMTETTWTLDRFKANEADHANFSASSKKGQHTREGEYKHAMRSPPDRSRVLPDRSQDADGKEDQQQQQKEEYESDNANMILGHAGADEPDQPGDRAAHEPLPRCCLVRGSTSEAHLDSA